MQEKKQSNSKKGIPSLLLVLTCTPLVLLVIIGLLVTDSFSEVLILSVTGLFMVLTLVILLLTLPAPVIRRVTKSGMEPSGIESLYEDGDTSASNKHNEIDINTDTTTNVTKLTSALRAVKSSPDEKEETMIPLPEHSGFGMFVLQNGRIREASTNLAEILDESLNSLNTWDINDLINRIHKEDVQYVVENPDVEGASAKRLSEKSWFRYALSGETFLWLEFLCKRIKYHDEDALLVTVMDISELKEFERKISEQKLFLEQIMDSFSQPFFVVDADSLEILIENSAARQRKIDQEANHCQALNPGCRTCNKADDICPVEIVKRTKLPAMVERKYIDDHGALQYVEVRAYPIFDKNNEVVSVLEHQQDVTFDRWKDRSLAESEERYADLFQKSRSVMLLLDPENGNIFDANQAACQFFGYEKARLTTLNISDISINPGEEELDILSLSLQNKQTQLHTKYKLASGEVRDVEVYMSAIRMSEKNLLFCIIHDITVRWQIETELKQRYDYETLATTLSTRLINLQSDEIDNGIEIAMKEIGEFTGIEQCFILMFDQDRNSFEITHAWSAPNVEPLENSLQGLQFENLPKALNQTDCLDAIKFSSVESVLIENEDEREFWQNTGLKSLLASPVVFSGETKGWYGFATCSGERDWSENDLMFCRISEEMFVGALESKRFEEQLKKSRDQLKELSAHIHDRVESERAHIAREVHDELGQLLTALKFDVSLLKNKLPKENIQLQEKGRTMMETIDEAIKSVQKITRELRPVMIDDLGLAPAIEWLAREFSERTGIECMLSLDEVEVEGPVAISLFRITQEALTNIGRHSCATELELLLNAAHDGIKLVISDNGIGITDTQISDHNSYGLMGLKERTSFLNGTINITGERGKGTMIDVWIPASMRGES